MHRNKISALYVFGGLEWLDDSDDLGFCKSYFSYEIYSSLTSTTTVLKKTSIVQVYGDK